MLIFTRKSEESFLLYTSDGVIEIKLADTDKNEVKVMLDAPKGVHVMRSELADR